MALSQQETRQELVPKQKRPILEVKSIEDQFLNEVKQELFPIFRSHSQEWCFLLRFHPNYKNSDHLIVANAIDKAIGAFSVGSINQTIKEVIQKLKDRYQQELERESNLLQLKLDKGTPGNSPEQSPWRLAYDWLWEKHFSRWLWQQLMAKARETREELRFEKLDHNRDPDFSDLKKNNIKINKGIPYRLCVESEMSGYLLLIDKGTSGTLYCFCPSEFYGSSNKILAKKPLYFPQHESIAESLKYADLGEESLLVIFTEKPLTLPWLSSDQNSQAIQTLNARSLLELWKELEQQSAYQMFKKVFTVIDEM